MVAEIAGYRSGDIVGWQYQAEIVCRSCMSEHAREMVARSADEPDMATIRVWAEEQGVDVDDERSYDSGDFPKIVFDMSGDDMDDACGWCLESVIDTFNELY